MTPGSTEAAIARGTTLLRRAGWRAGDRIVTQLGDDLSTFGVLAAACLEGIVVVPLPPDLPAGERADIVRDADPAAILADPGQVPTAPRDVGVPVAEVDPDRLRALPPTDPSSPWPTTRPMAYTSGTTGRRKGVHVGLHDAAWGRAVVVDEADAFDRRHGERHLVVSPLYHAAPFRFALVTALLGGEVSVLGRFDVERWHRVLRELRPTSLFCVPTHLQRLVGRPDGVREAFASLQLLAHAGAPCPEPVKRRTLDLAPLGSVWEFYGATEGQFTVCPPEVWLASPGTVGHARPGRSIEVRGSDGTAAPTGEVGTVWCTTVDHARFGYWRDPERTSQAWSGRSFTVGDLGSLDDTGRLTLAGRPGDLVISGGVNVYPAQVERVLLERAGVAEAVVFGVPDPDWGERVVAAVVPAPGANIDPDELRAWLTAQLRAAEVPKDIVVVDQLPRTATGKIQRVGLAEAVRVGPSAADGRRS